jgi:hypothetical protein
MGKAVLGGGWCTIEGLDLGFHFFARRRIWDDDFAKHGRAFFWVMFIRTGMAGIWAK